MDDFRRFVGLVHAKGMRIISIDNFGYASVEAVDFLKACDDVKAGGDSRETRFFSGATPRLPAAEPARYLLLHDPASPSAGYDSKKHEFWQWSERARKYYWTNWDGVDLAGNKVRLPQYNWGARSSRTKLEKSSASGWTPASTA